MGRVWGALLATFRDFLSTFSVFLAISRKNLILEGFRGALGRVWGGFWEGFGGSWPALGHFLTSFFGACIRNALQKRSWRLLGWILAPFSKVWEGSGEDLGRVWGVFGGLKIVVFLDRAF